jgi:hypothetical protein
MLAIIEAACARVTVPVTSGKTFAQTLSLCDSVPNKILLFNKLLVNEMRGGV